MLKNLKRDNIGEIGKSKRCVSLFLFFPLVSVIFLPVFPGGCVTAEQGFCCVYTRHKTPTKAFRSLQVCRYDVMQCAVIW